jgi:2-C-methyl-D-erythritol 4-phosphate cytidylyltransferase
MRVAAILLAAGRGERMGDEGPKAFLHLRDTSLLERAVAAVEACPDIEGFVVAAPPGYEARVELEVRSDQLIAVVTGGDLRQDSVRVALEELPEGFDVVICHDVARPLAPPKLFSDVLGPLEWADGAVPVVRVADTVKRVEAGSITETVSREELVLAQTPQAFRRVALWAAHAEARGVGYVATDDSALLERAGYRVEPVPGDPANIKVTTPEDLRLAEALLSDG